MYLLPIQMETLLLKELVFFGADECLGVISGIIPAVFLITEVAEIP